jgi:hypothetical protein
LSLSGGIDFLNTGKTIYDSVGNNNYGTSNPTSSGLCYSQGYMNGSSTTSGLNRLKSGSVVVHVI